MLIFTTRFSKKKAVLTVIVIGAVIAALVILAGHFQKGGNADLPQLTDNPQRVAYLQSLGWEIETVGDSAVPAAGNIDGTLPFIQSAAKRAGL